MLELRNRNIKKSVDSPQTEKIDGVTKQVLDEEKFNFKLLFEIITKIFGLVLMIIVSYSYSTYLKLLHENNLWFSNIKVNS
jgi:hypothetical protein